MFSQNTIRKEVLAVINSKIDAAEKEYSETISELDSKLQNEIEHLQRVNFQEKADAKDRIVNSILSKII